MIYITTEKEIPIQTYNLATDLGKFLIGYLVSVNFKYYIGKEQATLIEIFSSDGLLPLFLFDKQTAINEYITHINEKNIKKFLVEIEFIHDRSTLLDMKVNLKHNLIEKVFYSSVNCQYYYNFIEHLALLILNSQNYHIINGNEIHLDDLYEKKFSPALLSCMTSNNSKNNIIAEKQNALENLVAPVNVKQIKNFVVKKNIHNKKTKKRGSSC